MGNLSQNFSSEEFFCGCCNEGIPKQKLIDILETGRFILADRMHPAPVKIVISGRLRCVAHALDLQTKGIGVGLKSRHVFPQHADGVDIKAYSQIPSGDWLQINPDEVYKIFDDLIGDLGGVGKYEGRTHVDVRGHKARWDNT